MAFIKPIGSTCYGKTGMTYPQKIEVNWADCPTRYHRWEGFWSNTPPMYTFSDDESDLVYQWLEDNYPDFDRNIIIYLGAPDTNVLKY